MATNPPSDLLLSPISGTPRTVAQWLTVFHLLFVAVDPRSDRSRWILPTAANVLTDYEQADCRVAWLVAGDTDDARRFLGHWADDILTFVDPDKTACGAFGLGSLPAIVHLGMDGAVVNAVEGWDPGAWRALTVELSRIVSWSRPVIPRESDPGPFAGAPVKA
ncbi:MAG TPA: hypothetical protein VM121_00140 [Acidimicrobiales bacterium]|nr:hypothetical protein [Acidimicrobiales bacterium]